MAKVGKSELQKLKKKFVSDTIIGKKLGITRQAVHQLRKKYGIASSLEGNPERNANIIKMYKKGVKVAAIAKKFDLSISQVYVTLKKTGKAGKKPLKKKKAKRK